MQTIEIERPSCLVPLKEARADTANWHCEQLEAGGILFSESIPFEFPDEDRQFLLGQRLGDSRFHKNISYRPAQDVLRGFSSPDAAQTARVHDVMRRYSKSVVGFLSRLLSPYAAQWALDYASFRPEAEEHRDLPVRKRNDLLHVDAFPTRPTRGGRILRCFSNINPTEPRVWQTTDGFAVLARDHAQSAGLVEIAACGKSPWSKITDAFSKAVGLKTASPTPYDQFMLRFHDYLKENSSFQRDCRKIRLDFPPGSTWICFTDSVPHAVLQGQFAVEQTFIVPITAMVKANESPLRILEGIAGQQLSPDRVGVRL